MRKIIYLAIVAKLKIAKLIIQRISLWNNDLENLSPNKAFRTPAVFVEFDPIVWQQLSLGVRAADIRLLIHVVTRTLATPEDGGKYQQEALSHLDLIEGVNVALQGLSGEAFGSLTLVETIPDHSHDTLIHETLIYTTHVVDNSAATTFQSVQPKSVAVGITRKA